MKTLYIAVVLVGILLGFYAIFRTPISPFTQFNWMGLTIFIASSIVFVLSIKHQKYLPYVLFSLGILAMLNTYIYFKQCSTLKGIELFGGFFVSLAPLFAKNYSKKAHK